MSKRTATFKSALRLAILAIAAVILSGCSTYYQSYYPDSGVYYDDSGVYYGSQQYSRGGYGPVNPVDYPYWSIDYFYFSQYYHPYSVYVGYSEPLYYPYPGWAFGHYRPARWHGSLAFGFGYPWHGYGYRYPAYTFGFFSGYDPYYRGRYYRGGHHRNHRIRHIDQRLEALQYGDAYVSRRALLGRDRVAGRTGSGLYDTRSANRSANRHDMRDRSSRNAVRSARSNTRSDMLRQRGAQRSATLQRDGQTSDRSVVRQRRAPEARSDSRTRSRALDRERNRGRNRELNRNQIRRDGASAAADGHRGIPIGHLRNRVIVNSGARNTRNSQTDSARGRDTTRANRAITHGNIRHAPAVDRNRSQRQSRPDTSDNRSRANVPRRANRNVVAPSKRPNSRSAPPSRPARDLRNISRPEPARRASAAPSRRAIMRQSSGGDARSAPSERRNNRRR